MLAFFTKFYTICVCLLLLLISEHSKSAFICKSDDLCECKNISRTEFIIQCKNGRLMKLYSHENDSNEIFSIEFEKIGSPLMKKDFENYTEIRNLKFSLKEPEGPNIGKLDRDLLKGNKF